MTPELQQRILSLTAPGSSRDELLREVGVHDGAAWGEELLRSAVVERSALDVELALIVGFAFGFTGSEEQLRVLIELCSADWHYKHEDVVTSLGGFRSPAAVDALYGATQWVPDYLDFDESRALATKAIWALGGIPGDAAYDALVRLSDSNDPIVSDGARAQLLRRRPC